MTGQKVHVTPEFIAIDAEPGQVTAGAGYPTTVIKLDGNLPPDFRAGLQLAQCLIIDGKAVTLSFEATRY